MMGWDFANDPSTGLPPTKANERCVIRGVKLGIARREPANGWRRSLVSAGAIAKCRRGRRAVGHVVLVS